MLVASSIGSACSPNLASYITTRILGGFGGTFLLIAGQTMLADIFQPVCSNLQTALIHPDIFQIHRGRATACLMLGTTFGPAMGRVKVISYSLSLADVLQHLVSAV